MRIWPCLMRIVLTHAKIMAGTEAVFRTGHENSAARSKNKVVLVGDFGVGKSTLYRSVMGQKSTQEESQGGQPSNPDFGTNTWNVDGKTVSVSSQLHACVRVCEYMLREYACLCSVCVCVYACVYACVWCIHACVYTGRINSESKCTN